MELKAIFLDIDNTLLDFDAAAQQSMEESFHKFGLSFHPDTGSLYTIAGGAAEPEVWADTPTDAYSVSSPYLLP